MSVRLVILGFLRERPLYGYEIKQIIEDRMGDWTSIAFGSIYFALNKMTKDGLIEKLSTEQDGSRPSRTIYQITEAGHEEFQKLLRETWFNEERQHYSLDLGLFFLKSMPKEEVLAAFEGRIKGLEAGLAELRRHREERMKNPYIPRLAEPIFQHSEVHLEAELIWLKSTLDKFKSGYFD